MTRYIIVLSLLITILSTTKSMLLETPKIPDSTLNRVPSNPININWTNSGADLHPRLQQKFQKILEHKYTQEQYSSLIKQIREQLLSDYPEESSPYEAIKNFIEILKKLEENAPSEKDLAPIMSREVPDIYNCNQEEIS